MKQVNDGPSRIRIHYLRRLESHFFCLFALLRLLFSFVFSFFQPLRTRSSVKEGRHAADSHTQPLRSVRKGELRAHQERQRSFLPPGRHEGIEFRICQTKYIVMK